MALKRMILAALLLSGCSVPLIEPRPEQPVSARFSSATPATGAEAPKDWWARLGDAQLNALLARARVSSPDLRSAAAAVLSARAQAGQYSADLYPDVTGNASSTTSKEQSQPRGTDNLASIDASWEVDLFGRAAKQSGAYRLRAKSEELTYAGADVSLAAEVADYYVQYRACRMTEQIYAQALSSQRQTLSSTQQLVDAGMSTIADLSLARANVASSEISLRDQTADCRITAQSIANTVGAAQSEVDAILQRGSGLPPARVFRVSTVPSDVLRQRSDVAAAELDFSAALLDVGVAKADLYPSLTLGGSVTLTEPTSWSFGPSLSLPILDGGESRAAVRKSNADALTAAESYRSTVLDAVEEVENALTRLDAASKNLGSADVMVSQYRDYFGAVDQDWQAGGTTLLDREDARRQLQDAQVTQISQRETLLRQWIALYKATGGGWQRPAAPLTPTPRT